MLTKRIWKVKAVKWIGWQKFGCRVVSGRPSSGRTVLADSFPVSVRECFDMDEKNNIQSFTSLDAINLFVENGAKVKETRPGMFVIEFEVTTVVKRTNPQARERANTMKRDYSGRWTK